MIKCNHKYIDSKSAIEYCSTYEMRSSDMYCKICNKEATREELEKEQEERLTNQRAIEILKSHYSLECNASLKAAIHIAIPALEKGIPMKLDVCQCVCNAFISNSFTRYCYNCGQRIESEGKSID